MSDDPPELSADETEICRLTGMTPERYALLRDAPRQLGGGRSVIDVQAALAAPTTPNQES